MDRNEEKTLFALYIGMLLRKHADHQPLTDQEETDLEAWRTSSPLRQDIFNRSLDKQSIAAELSRLNVKYDGHQAVEVVFAALGLDPVLLDRPTPDPSIRIRRSPIRYWLAAAAVVLLIAGAWIIVRQVNGRHKTGLPVSSLLKNDIPPGRNTAILTLANGKQVLLDSLQNGALQEQDGTLHINKAEGQLTYLSNDAAQQPSALQYNTITTPRGGQFKLVLSDGTHVMLNAGSSIRYPIFFKGDQRKVFVTGEAWFDVAHDKQHPFIVEASKGRVEVLGTHFDIADYSDEVYMDATLVEGSVRMISNAGQMELTPGLQGRIERSTGKISIRKVDTSYATAWIKGGLALSNDDLAEGMRQISRWYDVDVVFEGKIPDVPIGGIIHRDVNLSTVLDFLKENGVHYTINGKKIIIAQ